MDIVLLKTFLEVARTRHFGKAADALFVTQSAVSARIKLLESTLGTDLFSRKRNDIQLTPAGHRLRRHAETIVRSWMRVSQELALGERFAQTLAIGAQADLWPVCLRDWVLELRRTRPDIALQLEILPSEMLVNRMIANQIDLAFLFEPPQIADLVMDQVVRIPLVMVSDRPDQTAETALRQDYVLVDWGSSFLIGHSSHFPSLPMPALRVSQGSLALDVLRASGGSAYLPQQMVRDGIDRGELYPVADAPTIERRAYAVYRPDCSHPDLLERVLRLVRGQV